MNKKFISILGWAFASCLYLWLFSLAQGKGLSDPPSRIEMIDSFILFSFMLLGGGASYHYLTEIASAPYSPSNSFLWNRLAKKMTALALVMLSAPLVILAFRDLVTPGLAWTLSFFYLLLSFGVSYWLAMRANSVFIEIRSNNSLQPTADASAE